MYGCHLLARVDAGNVLFLDEDILPTGRDLDRFLDEQESGIEEDFEDLEGLEAYELLLEEEAQARPPLMMERGGILHRFKGDDAIADYCVNNYLEHPQVEADGRVTAWCDYQDQRIQIGWIG